MARSIEQTLKKIRERIKPLLLEIYPNMQEEIQFAYEDNFQEWFGMLFKLNEWQLRPGMIDINEILMSETQTDRAQAELESYKEIEDYGFISIVQMELDFHLVDGYHRVLVARQHGISQIRGCIWEKNPNTHKNCGEIKKLIIDNL